MLWYTSPVMDVAEGSIKKALTSWGNILPIVLTGMEIELFNAIGDLFTFTLLWHQ